MAARALDTLVGVETPEGIVLTLRPAGLVSRCAAFAIDLTIRLAVLLAAAMLLSAMANMGLGLFYLLVFALEWLYPVLFELLPGSATPGKRAMGLRVVMDSGLPVTPAASLLRNLLRTVDALPGCYAVGLLLMLLRPDFKRIGDLAAGTLVVHRDAVALQGALPDAAPLLPARALSLREQAAIVAWAGRGARLTPERWVELAQLVAPVAAAAHADAQGAGPAQVAQRLSGIAQWLIGRR